jgi:hypothetical protein
MESSSTPQCHHIKTSGVRCGSPALRHRRYCYFHQRSRPLLVNLGTENEPILLSWPTLEDAYSIQSALRQVGAQLLNGAIDNKKAGLLLYALQIASSNLKRMKTETPQPEQVVVDPPELSEVPSQEPLAEPVRLNSRTTRLTHFPGPPSIKDEHEDDTIRQARELREELASQIHNAESKSSRKAETSKAGDNTDPNNGPPNGTIQACVAGPRERRSKYVN